MGSHRRQAASWSGRRARVAVGCLSAVAALGTLPPALASPRDDARAEVDRLHAEAERATEAHNAAQERADAARARVDTAQDTIARQQSRVNAMRDTLGALAGAEYRAGGIDPALALLFASDPDDYLAKATVLDRVGRHQAGELGRLHRALRGLTQTRAEARTTLAELERAREEVAGHRKRVERKLAEARRLVRTLSAEERAEHDRASRSGRIPGAADAVPASGRAGAAVDAARSALGKPYVWGATGPSSFDCSGLTQWSYAQAGVALPRTSQAQAGAGRRVSLAEARPGDLVTYRGDASHVAMYVGGGQVVHAPYPGAPVRYDPVGMMPIHAVTRV
ncbi:NlpC/P60 family protein [Streptomyces sp. ZYX-F-203]